MVCNLDVPDPNKHEQTPDVVRERPWRLSDSRLKCPPPGGVSYLICSQIKNLARGPLEEFLVLPGASRGVFFLRVL